MACAAAYADVGERLEQQGEACRECSVSRALRERLHGCKLEPAHLADTLGVYGANSLRLRLLARRQHTPNVTTWNTVIREMAPLWERDADSTEKVAGQATARREDQH
jgi:hypothetical protein